MKKRFLLFFLLFHYTCFICFAQKEANIWYYGYHAGLDFNSGVPVALTDGMVNTNEGCASICDKNGSLLFYTDGIRVWNRNHQQMPNGSGLMGTGTPTQSSLIAPKPGTANKYYIFTAMGFEDRDRRGLFCYSEVDMTLAGGMGDITTKNVQLFSRCSEKLTGVKHKNGVDIWIIGHNMNDSFMVYLLSSSGIQGPFISKIGRAENVSGGGAGYLTVSPNGKNLGRAAQGSTLQPTYLELSDFNTVTGLVSNPIMLLDTVAGPYGISFSPNSHVLYCNSGRSPYLTQWNLNSGSTAAIIASATEIFAPDYVPGAAIQIGPDKKLYIASQRWLHVVDSPDIVGSGCHLRTLAIDPKGEKHYIGLPNFIQSYFDIPRNDTVFYCGNGGGVRLVARGVGPNTWQVISGSGIISGSGNTVTVTTTAATRVIVIDSGTRDIDTITIIVPTAHIDAGLFHTRYSCGNVIDTLNALLIDTISWIPYIISWQPSGSVITSGNTLNPIVAPTTSTQYSITVGTSASQGGCIWEDTTSVIIIDERVSAQFSYTTGYSCNNDTVMFTNKSSGVGDLLYRWIFGDGASDTVTNPVHVFNRQGRYTVTLYVTNGRCTDTLTQVIVLEHPVKAGFTIQRDTICEHDTAIFINTSSGLGLHYNWDFDDGTDDTAKEPVHAYYHSGLYKVVLSIRDFIGCIDKIYRFVQVDAKGTGRFAISDSVCVGEPLTLTGSFGEVVPMNYTWDFGDGHSSFNNDRVRHAYTAPGTYYPVLTTRYRVCPEYTHRDTVQVFPYPSVNLGADTSLCSGQTAITLTNQLAGPDVYTSRWSTGSTAAGIMVSTPGIYWLMVTNALGCATTDTITINKGCYIAIPNAFTPNGDDVNDYFFPTDILGRSVNSFHMQIYNRWGNILFETNTTNGRGWDGTYNGSPGSEGVYVYVIEVLYANDVQEKYRGNVTLLR